MSEPITRADYAKWLLSCGDLEMHAMFEDWCAHNPAESASPPRVPGASAQVQRVGVESGPGQPIDICERLDNLAQQGRVGYPICDDIAEAAAEIRRLREQVKTERRAGIEAAAKMLEPLTSWSGPRGALATEVRALADKPAPDAARKGG